ncbi:MAG: DMT family transporter [Reyranellaceae bacterium]
MSLAAISAAWSRLPPTLRGIGWVALAGVLFSLLNAGLRYVSLDLPPMVTSFFRFLFGLVFIAPIVLRMGLAVFRTNSRWMQVGRNVVHASAFAIWYTALPLIPLAEMTAIMFAGPLFITVGAALFLGEKVRWRRWLAIVVGFVGVLIIVRPGFAEVGFGTWLMLSSVPVIAASQLIAKAQTKYDSTQTIVCWQTVLLVLIFLPPALLQWQTPSWEQLAVLLVCGVIGSAANMAMVQAFQVAEISAVQPMMFLNIVWASILGLIVFADVPDFWTLVGAGVIIASTSYIARREALRNRAAAPPPPEA